MQVRWNNSLSPLFSGTNGVRQGGVLSPILFTVYLDDLLSSFKVLGLNVIGMASLSALSPTHMTRTALLAPSPSALHLILKHCEEFAISRGLPFKC